MSEINRAVIVKVGPRGQLQLVRTLGDFTGAAIFDLLADLERGGGEVAPGSLWTVPLEEDHGDPDVGLPALGWVLDWDRAEAFEGRTGFEEVEEFGPVLDWPDITGQVLEAFERR